MALIKRKHIYKLLILYMLVCMFISTIFLVNNLQTVVLLNTNRCCFFQDIICKLNKTQTDANRNNDASIINPVAAETDRESIYDVRQVLKSLKNNKFSDEISDYKNILKHYVMTEVGSEKFDRPLSVYTAQDHNILQSMFPIRRPANSPREDRLTKQLKMKLKFKSQKIILVLFKSHGLSTHALNSNNCPIKECVFTHDETLLENADAVIFGHSPKTLKTPRNRKKQVWIYHEMESPQHGLEVLEQMNWTATYRSDSVLVTPYGKFVPFKNYSDLPSKAPRNYAASKTKVAAIFLSNCYAKNGRMKYIEELKKYVKVDIYGSCGDLSCDRNNPSSCFGMLKRDYKFYLAFENSNCRDYITEKFFVNALRNDVVPIVMGAHPDDYKKLAPPHSYIHVDEFDSPRQLAEYMNILDNNDDLYNLYFCWKNTGAFVDTNFACRLCSMLQISNHFPMWYKNVNKWWRDNTCISPDEKKGVVWSKWKKQLAVDKEEFDNQIILP